MKSAFYRLCTAVIVVAGIGSTNAQVLFHINPQEVITCPASVSSEQPPLFDQDECHAISADEIDPQDTHIWVRAYVDLTADRLSSNKPLAVFIMGKAASRVFINGRYAGANGMPATDRQSEMPGQMDHAFSVPKQWLVAGQNELILEMSAHHTILNLMHPIHLIAMGEYADPTNERLRHYWVSLIPFGALVLAAIYMTVLVISRQSPKRGLLMPMMAVFAATQLLAEVSRGLVAYAYPFHDWRLLIILFCSLGFGLCLLLQVIQFFARGRKTLLFVSGLILTLLSILMVGGYDNKATMAILMPSILAWALSVYAVIRRHPRYSLYAGQFSIVLLLFVVLIVLVPNWFLDVLFYYVIAAVVLFLFAHQAIDMARHQRLLVTAREQSSRLQMALEQKQSAMIPPTLSVNSAGKVERVATDTIAYSKAAGDYADIILADNKQVLYSGNLGKLEQTLPSTFLRVHRSYLINTSMIKTLQREASGVGRLILSNGSEIPVSRRIMPMVRNALK